MTIAACLTLMQALAGCKSDFFGTPFTRTLVGVRGGIQEYADSDGTPPHRLIDDLDHDVVGATFELKSLPLPRGEDKVLLSFIHVSDVQMRDFEIYYESPKREPLLDSIAHGTTRPEGLDRNEEAPFASLVYALNELNTGEIGVIRQDERPLFLIHTGDSVDVGTVGELFQYMNIANRLLIPWFNVVGNHDVFVLGNFPQRNLRARSYDPSLRFLTDRTSFRGMHERAGSTAFFSGSDTPSSIRCHPPSGLGTPRIPSTTAHGFDLEPGPSGLTYAFSIASEAGIKFRVIVLDTVARDQDTLWADHAGIMMPGPGAFPSRLDDDQFRWLETTVKSLQKDEYALVFGHHPLDSEEGPLTYDGPTGAGPLRLVDYLRRSRRILGYFAGHTHSPRITEHPRFGSPQTFVEVVAPSIHERPQLAFNVVVRWIAGARSLAVDVRPVKGVASEMSNLGKRLLEACNAAMKDPDTQSRPPKLDEDTCWLAPSTPLPPDVYRTVTVATGVICPLCNLQGPPPGDRPTIVMIGTPREQHGGSHKNVGSLSRLLSRFRPDWKVVEMPITCGAAADLPRQIASESPQLLLFDRAAFGYCTGALRQLLLSLQAAGGARPRILFHGGPQDHGPPGSDDLPQNLTTAFPHLDMHEVQAAADFDDSCVQEDLIRQVSQLLALTEANAVDWQPILDDPLPRALRQPRLLRVPAGEFDMGTPVEEVDSLVDQCRARFKKPKDCRREYFADESPVIRTYVSEFWIDDVEVSQGLYAECVDAKECKPSPLSRPADGANRPIVGVRWVDAANYCRFRRKRLPTEAEWEKAARWNPESKLTQRFPWGSAEISCDKARYGRDPEWSDECTYTDEPFLANVDDYGEFGSPIGALNMVGNAWEIVDDDYKARSATDSTNDPHFSDGTHLKTVKGGGWSLHSVWVRPADRYSVREDEYNPAAGFRCATSTRPVQ